MAGSTKAQQKSAIDRQMAHLQARKELLDIKEKLAQAKSKVKSLRARRQSNG
jgi:hypothetical protein